MSDGKTVLLSLSSAISGQYVVTVNNVQDPAGNTITANSKATNTVLNLQPLAVFGDAASVSSSAAYTGNVATISGGGSDIFGASDNFVYAYLTVTNDFDYMLRVQSVLNVGNAFGRAGLMVRDDIVNNNGHEAMAAVNAGNTYQMLFRTTVGGGTTAIGPNTAFGSNSWVRLQRYGTVFTAFQSSNAVNWVQIGTFDAAANGDNSFTNSVLYLGIAVSSHNVSTPTTAVVSDMSVIPGTAVSITNPLPANTTWIQDSQGTITIGAAGSLLHYQWQSNGVDISGAVFATYTNPMVGLGDGGTYSVRVYNAISVGGVTSIVTNSTSVTVSPDTAPPRLTGTYSYDGLTVGIEFNEIVDPLTATNPANYTIAGTTVTNVTLGADGRSVVLWLSASISGPFGVAVSGVTDTASASNIIPSGSSAGNSVGAEQLITIGDGSLQPASATYAGNTGTITGGGSDIFGTADGLAYAVMPIQVTGDFDYRMRVLSVANNNVVDAFARIGIMARVSTNDPGSSHFGMYVNNGNNGGLGMFQCLFRRSTAAGNNSVVATLGTGNAFGSNSWVRLQRTGPSFNVYFGSDGFNWTLLRNIATNATSGAFSNTLYLGIAVNAHNNSTTATGVVSDFGPTPILPPVLSATRSGNNVLLGWPGILPGFVVQEATSLSFPVWSTAVAAPPIVSGNFQATIPTTNSVQFFRLKQ
jgi:hypothetical protein